VADGKRRIMVIDDDAAQRALIPKVLKDEPFSFTLCGDAESALVHLNDAGGYELVICDFMLPGISGLQVVEYIRRSKTGAKTPIIMMSSHGGGYEVGDRARAAGANAFLSKPFSASELRAAVQSVTEKATAAREP
jgi:DNA-binding response OmpR family regulator